MQLLEDLRERVALLQALQTVWERRPLLLGTVSEQQSPVQLIDALDRRHVFYVDACGTWKVWDSLVGRLVSVLSLTCRSGSRSFWRSVSVILSAGVGWRVGGTKSQTRYRGIG